MLGMLSTEPTVGSMVAVKPVVQVKKPCPRSNMGSNTIPSVTARLATAPYLRSPCMMPRECR